MQHFNIVYLHFSTIEDSLLTVQPSILCSIKTKDVSEFPGFILFMKVFDSYTQHVETILKVSKVRF